MRDKGDHKRKSRPIAPATVTVDADSITIVVPDVLGKNESHVAGHDGARHTSAATKRYRASVAAGVAPLHVRMMFERMFSKKDPGQIIRVGAWRLEVVAVWPRERHTIDGRPVDFTPCPMGDADAAIPQALDALQHAGVLDDDARVVEVRAWNLYRKDQRATIIRLSRVPDLAIRDEAIAHLFGLVPVAPAEPRCGWWKVGARCHVLGEAKGDIFEVVETTSAEFPNSVYLHGVSRGTLKDHGRESVDQLERAVRRKGKATP